MQNRTDIVGVSLWDRIRQFTHTYRELFAQIAAALAGFVMAGSCLFDSTAPFGVALSAAVPYRFGITAAAGAVLGYTFTSPAPLNMKYIVAVLMVIAARWLFEPKAPKRFVAGIAIAISSFALAVASAAVLVLGDNTLYDLIMAVAEVFLTGGAAYFFSRGIGMLSGDWRHSSRSDLSCVIIALAVALVGMSSLAVAGLSVGRILAVVAVLLCARYGGEAGGAIGGIIAGVSLGLAGGDYSYLLTTYGLGGLLSGVFGGMGRIATAASFIFINTITALFTQNYHDVYTSILEVFAATVIFVAIPSSAVNRLGIMGKSGIRTDTASQQALCERIEDISGALQEICTTTQQVSERLGKLEATNYASVYTKVAEKMCLRCGMKSACWQIRYNETIDAMQKCIGILKKDGTLTKDQLPERFAGRCCKADDFMAALNAQFHDYVAREGVQRKVSKVRSVVTDQFEGIALMLDEIAKEVGEMKLLDPARAKQVREYFAKEGIEVRQALCYSDQYDRMTVDIQIPTYQAAKLKSAKSALDLCGLLDADFDQPQITTREKYVSVQYSEKAAYTIELGAYQIAAGSGRLCGDAYDFIRNRAGKSHFILSDGMGSGGSAAVDSAMASGLISRLISVGIGYEAALKMVNSALLIKSGEESLATIDICSVDLFTGKTEFYKAGAAPTYIVKNGKAGYVESTSLPAGILRGVAFEKSGITLHEGDIIVMVSDGVIASGADWVKSELENAKGCDAQRLCEKIANTAKLRRTDGREDDITVLAAAVQRGA